MKALQIVKPRQFQTVEIDRPEAGRDQILVRWEKAVLCGSDIPKFTGLWRGLQYPLPPGMPIHECVGVVVESHSPRFQVGDRVVAVPLGRKGLAEYYVADAAKAVRIPDPLAHSEVSLLIQPLSTYAGQSGRSLCPVRISDRGSATQSSDRRHRLADDELTEEQRNE